MDAGPDVLNHNIESVPRVFQKVRPKGDYQMSLELLAKAKEMVIIEQSDRREKNEQPETGGGHQRNQCRKKQNRSDNRIK